MKMIYLPDLKIENDIMELTSDYFINYIKNVLRYKEGERLFVSNEGHVYEVIIKRIRKKIIYFDIISKEKSKAKKRKVVLIQSLFSWPRFEWLTEKCVELGVTEIILVKTQRSKIKISNWKSKKDRFEKIIYKALTQSKQSVPLKLKEPIDLKNLKLDEGMKIMFDTKDENLTFTPSIINNESGDIYVAIGPEGGFTEEEKEFFVSLGFSSYKMPLPVLRAETAAVASLVLIMSELGENYGNE